jgi:hypothetical protein
MDWGEEARGDMARASASLQEELRGRSDILDVAPVTYHDQRFIVVLFAPNAPCHPETLPIHVNGWRVDPVIASPVVRQQIESMRRCDRLFEERDKRMKELEAEPLAEICADVKNTTAATKAKTARRLAVCGAASLVLTGAGVLVLRLCHDTPEHWPYGFSALAIGILTLVYTLAAPLPGLLRSCKPESAQGHAVRISLGETLLLAAWGHSGPAHLFALAEINDIRYVESKSGVRLVICTRPPDAEGADLEAAFDLGVVEPEKVERFVACVGRQIAVVKGASSEGGQR